MIGKAVQAAFLAVCILFLASASLSNSQAAAPSATANSTPNVPVGTVLAYAGKDASVPKGFLLCNGQEVSVRDFPGLYRLIGTIYGGDGATKFRVPDLRGRTIIGTGQGGGLTDRLLGGHGGEESHTLTPEEMPEHSHVQVLDDKTGTYPGSGQADGNGADGAHSGGVENGTTRNAGGGRPHNTMPPFISLNYIIKT